MPQQARFKLLIKEAMSSCPRYKDALRIAAPFATPEQIDKILKQGAYDRFDSQIYRTIEDCLYSRRPDKTAEIWQNVISAAEFTRPKLIDNDFSGLRMTQLDRNIIAHMGIDLASFILCRQIINIGYNSQMEYKICNEAQTRTASCNTHYYMPRSSEPTDGKPQGYAMMDVDDYQLDDDIHWISGSVQMPQLPDTVADALIGQKLSALIDHPVFRDYDIKIIHVRQAFKESLVKTDYHPRNWPSIDIVDIANQELSKLAASA